MTLPSDLNEQLEKPLNHLKEDVKSLKTGRAHPALVESIMVEAYNSKMPLNQVAGVAVQDARTILISPFDQSTKTDIEKAIAQSDLGVSPSQEGENIRINLPELSAERREEIVKLLHQKVEQAKIAVRRVREDIIKGFKQGDQSEDETNKDKAALQKNVDEINQSIDDILKKKESEIRTI